MCNPSRNAIITGVYAASNGNENKNSRYPTSPIIRTYAEILCDAGYYCTKNAKTAYCSSRLTADIWDENSPWAHYLNRPAGKPFFAVFDLFSSHETTNQMYTKTKDLRHDADKVVIPPYHPGTEEVRHDWAQYYDRVENMDTEVDTLLRELDDAALSENTIVFGGTLPRS